MSETAKYSVFFGEYQRNADDQEEFADARLGQIVAPAAVRWPNRTPVAWAPAWPGGGKSSHQILEESIAAGRVIEFKDGKYIARGISEEKGEEKPAAFRIGGHYRDKSGVLVLLYELCLGSVEPAAYARRQNQFGRFTEYYGSNFLHDGRNCKNEGEKYDLLPGELHFINGAWVREGEEMPADQDVDDGGPYNGLADSSFAMRDSDTNPKPALTWNKPTFFDPFKGYEVSRSDRDPIGFASGHASPYTRLGDTSNPLHGSAMLKKG